MFPLSLEGWGDKHVVLGLLVPYQFFTAFQDVITDAIMVKVCKIDRENGSADFQTYIFGICGLGGIVGSIVAIFLTDTTNPRTTFFYYSFCHLILIAFVIPVPEGD